VTTTPITIIVGVRASRASRRRRQRGPGACARESTESAQHADESRETEIDDAEVFGSAAADARYSGMCASNRPRDVLPPSASSRPTPTIPSHAHIRSYLARFQNGKVNNATSDKSPA